MGTGILAARLRHRLKTFSQRSLFSKDSENESAYFKKCTFQVRPSLPSNFLGARFLRPKAATPGDQQVHSGNRKKPLRESALQVTIAALSPPKQCLSPPRKSRFRTTRYHENLFNDISDPMNVFN
jgi:hypothetical protein